MTQSSGCALLGRGGGEWETRIQSRARLKQRGCRKSGRDDGEGEEEEKRDIEQRLGGGSRQMGWIELSQC